jgi:WD40 repeat protein
MFFSLGMKITSPITALYLLSIIGALASPEKPNLEDDIMPIFESKCNSCHNADRARGGLDLTNMNAILVGGSSGESVISGDGENSYLYKLIARVEKPYMPQREEKMPQDEIDLVKKWIDLGLLPTATGKPIQKKKSTVNLALGNVSVGKPDGPPPMPRHLSLEPSVVTNRAFAPSAMASAPWSPLVAIAGQKQVLLYNTETLNLMGVLPYPEGFIESLTFSRNGKLIVAGGGRGGKSGRVAAWEVESGKRLLTMGDEYDAILTADLSADQSLLAIGSPSKLIKVYDVASNETLYEIKKHSEWVTQVAFSPDGILLATADRNGGLHIWEAETGNPFYTLDGHKQGINDLSWRADSNILVSVCEEGSVRTWEMINGKQVKSWNAHPGGTMTAYFDSKGNIVTGGRDKNVKLWTGDGKGIRTVSDFNDIIMEVCYSHDGSRIIAGDWSGQVSVWNTSDGKKVGDLRANPLEIGDSLNLAKQEFEKTKRALEHARTAHDLAVKSTSIANAEHAKNIEILAKSENENKLATAAHTATEKMWKDSIAVLQKMGVEKASKDKEYKELKVKLKKLDAKLLKDNQILSTESSQQKERTALLAIQKEAHQKIVAAAKDSNDTQPLAASVQKTKSLEDLVEKSTEQVKKLQGVVNQTLLSKKSIEQNIMIAEKNLSASIQSYNLALEKKKKMDLERNDKITIFKESKTKLATAKNNISKSQEALNKAEENSKKPLAEFVKAEKNFKQAEYDVSRWNAEIINVKRHIELRNLRKLESELNEYEVVLNESRVLKNSAQKAFQNMAEYLQKLPETITRNKELLAQKKIALIESEKRKVSVLQVRTDKNLFIQEVSQLATLAKNKSQTQEPDSTFGQASDKFQETISLLKKDLAETENLLAAKEQEILQAREEVNQAENSLTRSVKLLETTPSQIKDKEQILQKANSEEELRQKEFDLFKSKVDQQSAKSDALFQKYLGLLPKN